MNAATEINPAAVLNDSEAQAIRSQLERAFAAQREAYLASPMPNLKQRRADLEALRRMIGDNVDAIVDAICADYGNRSRHESLFAEIISGADAIIDCSKRLRGWMKPQKRHVDQSLFPGGRSRVIPQPLGVVGLIIPWNFPIMLCFSQLAAAFAAGNRAMVKMSENSRTLTRLLQSLAPKYLEEDKLVFFEETGGVGIEFSKIPFDLLIFTGSGNTGRSVMAAAAQNLTPVILELGGKAPAVIDPDYPMQRAVERIMFTKQFNAGQICTNVDYVFVHKTRREEFVELAKAWVAEHVPDINSQDYTSVIDDRAFTRLMNTLDDAREKGATLIPLNHQEPNPELRKIPLTLVLDTTADMTIRQRETFGPLLMVMEYEKPQEVVTYVNAGDRPLALYPFSNDKRLQNYYIERIMSGGVTVNDALFHVAQHDLPFGGVGASGMGHYHGYEGFVACSKLRPVFYQPWFTLNKYLAPPYGKLADKAFGMMVKQKTK